MFIVKNLAAFGLLISVLVSQTACMLQSIKAKPEPCDNVLKYYNGHEIVADKIHILQLDNSSDACLKLRQAVIFSMPGSKQQCDEKALLILKDLKHKETLSDKDQKFNNMLLQHVSQRQYLRKMIATQALNLKKIKTQNIELQEKIKIVQAKEVQNTVLRNHLITLQSQLDQLKNIEVEIDKKERSVISPIVE